MSETDLRTEVAHSATCLVRREMRRAMYLRSEGYQSAWNSKTRDRLVMNTSHIPSIPFHFSRREIFGGLLVKVVFQQAGCGASIAV